MELGSSSSDHLFSFHNGVKIKEEKIQEELFAEEGLLKDEADNFYQDDEKPILKVEVVEDNSHELNSSKEEQHSANSSKELTRVLRKTRAREAKRMHQDLFAPADSNDEEYMFSSPTTPPQNAINSEDRQAYSHILPHNIPLATQASTSSTVRRKRQFVFLPKHKEMNLAEWYRDHELLYNKKLTLYRDREMKDEVYRKKADELNMSVGELQKWLEGMRTRYAKALAKSSGQGYEALSEREAWIKEAFSFLEPHIVRCHGRKTKRQEVQEPLPTINDVFVAAEEDTFPPMPSQPYISTETELDTGISAKRAKIVDENRELIEKIGETMQENLDVSNKCLALFDAPSSHALEVKHFHQWLATVAGEFDKRTYLKYSNKVYQLINYYRHNPVPTDPVPKSCQQPHSSRFGDSPRWQSPTKARNTSTLSRSETSPCQKSPSQDSPEWPIGSLDKILMECHEEMKRDDPKQRNTHNSTEKT